MSSSERENEKVDDNEPEIDFDDGEEDDEVVRRNGSRRNRNDEDDLPDDDELPDDRLPDDEEDDIFGDADDDVDNQDNDRNSNEEVTLRIEQTTIPRYPRSHRPLKDLYYVPTPSFMTMEPHPFEASKFQEELSEEQSNDGGLKVRNENTVRWKYAKDSKGNVIKQSNSRIIKWSDGSMSLQLGQELFDIVIQDPYDQTFLCLSHPANGLLQTAGIFTKNMRIVPTSTTSRSHKRLAQELTVKQLTASTSISSVATTDDPEKVQREAEKVAEMTLRARRKLESKQRLQMERIGGTPTAVSGNSPSRYPYGGDQEDTDAYQGRVPTRAGDEYEEDDFVVDDEDEEGDENLGDEDDEGADDLDDLEEDDEEVERKRAQRLHDLKQKGAELYSNRSHSEEHDSQQTRKKRRIFDDEEDDE